MDSSNMYGLYFEKAKNQINGLPLIAGDFGIRYAFSDRTYGVAFYTFIHVAATGQNLMSIIYLDDAILNKPFL